MNEQPWWSYGDGEQHKRQYAAVGVRLGVMMHLATGFVRNGEIIDPSDLAALAKQGYTFEKCDGVPEYGTSPEELKALEDARARMTKSRRWMGEAARDVLAPLKKRFHLNPNR